LLMPSRKYVPYSVCLKLHNGALKEEEDANAERRPSYRKRNRKSVYARNAAGKRAEEQAVEEELKDMVTEGGTPRKKVIYPVVGHDGSCWIVLANITQARFGIASPDPKKEVERQRGFLRLVLASWSWSVSERVARTRPSLRWLSTSSRRSTTLWPSREWDRSATLFVVVCAFC
jgi:hypothetical protein